MQIDAVAINWRTKDILLGEAKWQGNKVELAVVRELVEDKQPKVLKALPKSGEEWTVYFACFARAGFTATAQGYASEHEVQLVDLEQMDHDLAAVL